MANIMFKRGQQANLPSTAQDGVFYLTTDTNRLYVGQGTAMTLLNQQVHVVANVSAIPKYPEVNDFYYCTSENILAFYNGTDWKQINPDTDTNDTIKVSSVTVGDSVVAEKESITYNIAVNQQKFKKDGSLSETLSAVNFALKLTKEDLEAIIHDPANVGLKVSGGTNAATIGAQGTGSNAAQTATIKGGSNVTVSANGSNITVSAADSKYALSNSGTTVTMKETGSSAAAGSVAFKASTDLTVTSKDGEITYSHAAISTEEDTATQATSLTHGGTIDVVTDIGTTNGHVTKVTTKKYQLPADTSIKQINGTGGEDWIVEIEETDGKKFAINFSTDAAALETELRNEISKQLAAANTALTYKGNISSYNALALKENVEIGDVYLLSAKDGTYEIGDMFIATVKEGGSQTNGVIADGSVEWQYVPSGDELNTDTLFSGNVTITEGGENAGKVKYELSAHRGADDDGKTPAMPSDHEDLTIKAGKDITISGTGTEATIAHKTYSAVTPSNSNASSATSFTAITGVTLENGHVTGLSTQKFTPNTYTLSGVDNQIQLKTGAGNVVKAISVEGDKWVNASVASDKLTLTHAAPQTTGGTTKSVTNTTTLAHGGKLNILTGVTYDANGHISDVTTGELTLPTDNNTTYNMFVGSSTSASAAVSTATANPYVVLRDSSGKNNAIRLNGDSGSLSVSGNAGAVTISMVWGTF